MALKNSPLRWGILSTGNIARSFAQGILDSRKGRLEAVGSRELTKAQAFAHEFRIPAAYGSYKDLLRDPKVEAVYIATPHPQHAPWTLQAARAGKHILCEKPLTMDQPEARRVLDAARKNSVFLMEAFLFRCHPQTQKIIELIKGNALGDIRFIRSSFCFERNLDLRHRLFNRRLGGGAILDVGCYPVAMARLLAGAALGKAFVEPLEIRGLGVVGKKSGVDEMALANLKFPGGILAELSCSIRSDRGPSYLKIDGTLGSLVVPSPWSAERNGGTSYLYLRKKGRVEEQRVSVRCDRSIYTVEADTVADAVRKGLRESPAMPWADSLGNMAVLDAWRKAVDRS